MKDYLLIVDDDPDDVEWAILNFEKRKAPYAVEAACNGVDALERLERAAAAGCRLPALILLDIKMPKMDGLELLERLGRHAALKAIPVILLTSSQNEDDIRRGFALGARRFQPKVADMKSFEAILRAIGEVLDAGR